eukprot:323831_1
MSVFDDLTEDYQPKLRIISAAGDDESTNYGTNITEERDYEKDSNEINQVRVNKISEATQHILKNMEQLKKRTLKLENQVKELEQLKENEKLLNAKLNEKLKQNEKKCNEKLTQNEKKFNEKSNSMQNQIYFLMLLMTTCAIYKWKWTKKD